VHLTYACSKFFVDKIQHIWSSFPVLSHYCVSSCHRQATQWASVWHVRPGHCGTCPSTPSKTASQVITTWHCSNSLLKSCSEEFAVITISLNLLTCRLVKDDSHQLLNCRRSAISEEDGANRPDPANYWPISNLSTISKVLERLVLAQLWPHVFQSNNFCPLQSGIRNMHRTFDWDSVTWCKMSCSRVE